MKKTYITPSIECISYCTENVMALSIIKGGKADGNKPALSNGFEEYEWDDDELF